MSYLDGLTRAFQLRLAENIPTGYTVSDISNIDRGVELTTDSKYLEQSTVLGLRQQTAADVKRCIRQFYIHTIAIYVPYSNREERAGILSTVSELQTLFEKKEFGDYVTQTSAVDIVGKQSGSKFYRVDVNINGYYEEIL